MSSDSSEYLDLTAEVNSQAITGILCDSLHTPVSKICRLTRRLCVDLLLDPAVHGHESGLHICLQASDALADYLLAEICAVQNVRLDPLVRERSLQPHKIPLQFAAISCINDTELSFVIGSAMFLYRYGEDGPLIDHFFQGLGRAAYMANMCDANGVTGQQSTACVLCTHVVLLPA
ncbi:hypothetical protein GL50803_0020066 [Giardia duodenalis]|uniref:Uncharacterized protein n=1 Tax=Giardia intestinalis (strain ATCC 50803 / WB clone C6) TaxID=184922 RepID=D3KGJ0_GIAIC|nr:hypothetical protein GL50803_0020066 [Giardia intestinalis]KAE8305370.1 hypothetical protein GL50803_0020066 [Giardia intestinalis]